MAECEPRELALIVSGRARRQDVCGQVRRVKERLVARAVWRKGDSHPVTEEPVWPNPESQAWCVPRRHAYASAPGHYVAWVTHATLLSQGPHPGGWQETVSSLESAVSCRSAALLDRCAANRLAWCRSGTTGIESTQNRRRSCTRACAPRSRRSRSATLSLPARWQSAWTGQPTGRPDAQPVRGRAG